ncbi:alpha/beta hydrolase [Nocardia huaxiensis]|uniref:Alpha/beta hydrolase n=1 Tax=Nocardia huaxiensis TaxID=2755382 RepID=A0A7D6VE37_9NOCA|nr:alpha/beta hydrolase [Nocardia huaxiensis]QLY28036.1 alpha/beta hydrolase [Nocardia huaxiensis]
MTGSDSTHDRLTDNVPSTVTVQLANRAGPLQRTVHGVVRHTARRGIDALVGLSKIPAVNGRAEIFWVSHLADPPARVLPARRGTRRQMVRFEKFRAEWVWHRSMPAPLRHRDSALLWMHGGGLIACGLNTHRRLVSRVARESDMPVFNVDYRMIPAAHITETVEDCVTAYTHLLDQGFPAERIIVGGDSAGGGLAFATALTARDRGLPTPGAIAAMSPWANFDATAKIAHPNNATDALLSGESYAIPPLWAYAVDGKLDPAWSPVNHDFTGMPPVFIQIGSTEVLMSDVDEIAQRCADAGVPCLIQVWDRGFHEFQNGHDILPDARAAVRAFSAFNRSILAATDAARWTAA